MLLRCDVIEECSKLVGRKRKLSFAGHVLRGSGGDSHLLVLEGKINGKRGKGRPRLTWMDSILRWIKVGSFTVQKMGGSER